MICASLPASLNSASGSHDNTRFGSNIPRPSRRDSSIEAQGGDKASLRALAQPWVAKPTHLVPFSSAYPGRRQRSLRSRFLALRFDRDVASRLKSSNTFHIRRNRPEIRHWADPPETAATNRALMLVALRFELPPWVDVTCDVGDLRSLHRWERPNARQPTYEATGERRPRNGGLPRFPRTSWRDELAGQRPGSTAKPTRSAQAAICFARTTCETLQWELAVEMLPPPVGAVYGTRPPAVPNTRRESPCSATMVQ